jgi:hypothetical protein
MNEQEGWPTWVELESLDYITRSPHHEVLLVAVLEWVRCSVVAELGSRLEGVYSEVVALEYVSRYPVIGLRMAPDLHAEEIRVLFEGCAESILRTATLANFLRFAASSPNSWVERTEQILTPVTIGGNAQSE